MTAVRNQIAGNEDVSIDESEFDLDDIARILVGEITDYQHQPKTRAGTTIDRSRQREVRRSLVRTPL